MRLKPPALSFALLIATAATPAHAPTEMERWQQQAQNVTIIRDDWGIAHVYGKTDADAVFGMIYAQAEDDFNRVETNYLTSLGRLSLAEGPSAIWKDLRQRLFINDDTLKVLYQKSPVSLQKLMTAWADGLNFYLATHPSVHPKAITKFEPWMPLSFSEGSIGGDIESISLAGLETFYGKAKTPSPGNIDRDPLDREPRGSNGIAIAPQNTSNGRALLLINPHTSFFFRSELQMVSDEGLDVYGAATWGQFFIYQGFNTRLGFMHTSSGADATDEFAETITKNGDKLTYRYGNEERPVTVETIGVPVRDSVSGRILTRTFTVYRTHHGPIVREQNGKWIATALMNTPIPALEQSFGRTKAKNLKEYQQVMDLHGNSSNNTLYADADGNIGLFYVNFLPRRNAALDYRRPVDGSDPATDWKGLFTNDEVPHAVNPASGFVYNSNDWPWDAAGKNSINRSAFPEYIEEGKNEAPRGIHALRLLSNKHDFSIQGLIDAAFDSYQPSFATMIPQLVAAYDQAPDTSAVKKKVAEQIALLRKWDFRWGINSVENSLAVYYSQQGGGGRRGAAATQTPEQMLQRLAAASDKLTADFGSWKTPWGEINRFQRNDGEIVQKFDDSKPSIPVMFSSANWGSLASFGARTYPGTKKMYGTSGNSFVAVVEFGKDSVRARAVTAGGESGDPKSKHFNDQAQRYATGNLRPVYFYRNQLAGHTERTYHPGQ
jgi:acyl-homoserine-lactone acylase